MESEIKNRFRTPLLAFFTFLGFLFAYIESNRVSNGAYIPMENVSLPDGHQAINFDLGEHNELYALTKDGEVFMRWANGNEGGWVRPDDKQSPIVLCNEMSFADLPVPKPPGKSIQSIDCFTLSTPDARTYERFVILSNGEIWHWKLIKGIAEGFASLATLFIFGLLFTVAGYGFGLAAPRSLQKAAQLFSSRIDGTKTILGLSKNVLLIVVSILLIIILILLLYLTIRGMIWLLLFFT